MFGLQPPGGIHQQQIRAFGARRTNGIENHGSRISVGCGIGHHRHIAALSPHFHLLHGSSPEGVGSGNHGAVTASHRQIGELAESGGFADPIHPHHQPDVEAPALWRQKLKATGLNGLLE